MASAASPKWYPLIVLVLCAVAGLGAVAMLRPPSPVAPVVDEGKAEAAAPRYTEIPFDGAAAMAHLESLCKIGPRPSGSEGMRVQQDALEKYFTGLGAKVVRQKFQARHPLDGSAVELANLIISWNPDSRERFLLCAHYDTRPFPDRDPVNPRGKFVGANDGAAGTAILMELGRHMAALKSRRGVDFVLFDGEELVFSERDRYFLGSEYFAQNYRADPPTHRYRQGVLLDLVGDKDLHLPQEQYSVRYAPAVVGDVWGIARRLNVAEFHQVLGQAVRDDHLPLNEIAHIPTADIIDFDYPHWHTEGDLPDKCSAGSLEKVGRVVHEWLRVVVQR